MSTKSGSEEDEEEEEFEQEGRGRSARKRVVQTFDVMALELLELSDERCAKLPITDEFKRALHDARTTRSKSARRRYIRHLAGLLRDRDTETEAIKCYLAGVPYTAVSGDESYRDLNAMREALCDRQTFATALDEVGEKLPHIDIALVKRLAESLHGGEDDKAHRSLFRELRRAADESDRDAEE
jgi:ribosome-associated protein